MVSEHFRGSGFKVFAGLLEQAGTEVRAIPAPGGGSRAFCDRMNAYAQGEGLPGMGYIFWRARGGRQASEAAGPIAKALGPERTEAIREALGSGEGDAAFFLAGQPAKFEAVAGKARNVIGKELGLTAEDRFDFCWIVDFPMYEQDPETGKLDFSHNPFSMPQGGLEALEAGVRWMCWDISTISSATASSCRRGRCGTTSRRSCTRPSRSSATTGRYVDAHFGGMMSAFRYGAPPHAGIAPGSTGS